MSDIVKEHYKMEWKEMQDAKRRDAESKPYFDALCRDCKYRRHEGEPCYPLYVANKAEELCELVKHWIATRISR